MAFGSTMTAKPTASGDGEKKVFEVQWIDPLRGLYREGSRRFRILPAVDANGHMLPGDDNRGYVPDETRFAEYWIPVMQGGRQRQQRVMVDWQNPFKNPVWERLYADLPKEVNGKPNPNRKLPKQRFALNVLDKTRVLFDEQGNVVYPNPEGRYFIMKDDKKVELQGTPTPLMRVRVLEGSAGRAGGKHMLQQLADLVGVVTRPDDKYEVTLHLHEFDITIKVAGKDTDTRRSFHLGSDFKPLTAEQIALPRYDLDAWAKPWPNEVLDALLDGEDFDEVMKDAGIRLFPTLPAKKEDDATDEDEALFEE